MTTVLPDLQAELAKLRAENAALIAEKASQTTIKFKVSGKGAVSAYGLGQFPVTLYSTQWERLLATRDSLLAFIKANQKLMASKGVAPTPELVAHMAAHAKAQAAKGATA